jgi:hypothetical protein
MSAHDISDVGATDGPGEPFKNILKKMKKSLVSTLFLN